MRVRLVGVVLCLGLAACQMSLPFRKSAPPAPAPVAGVTAAPGAIMGGAITATPITGTPITPGGKAPVATPAAAAVPQIAAQAPAQSPAQTPAAAVAAAVAVAVAPASPADAAAPPTPPEPKSEAQLACERKKGSWSAAGKGFKSCVFRTRDGGKTCDAEADCDGLCLARSGTCSPVKPLFGCNEILDSIGRKVTLCID